MLVDRSSIYSMKFSNCWTNRFRRLLLRPSKTPLNARALFMRPCNQYEMIVCTFNNQSRSKSIFTLKKIYKYLGNPLTSNSSRLISLHHQNRKHDNQNHKRECKHPSNKTIPSPPLYLSFRPPITRTLLCIYRPSSS